MGNGCSPAKSGAALPPDLPSLKIALVGDPGVGKSSVLLRYTRNQFSPLYIPTKKVGIENIVRKLNVPANTVVSLTLWDIPGREDMDMHKSYFRNLDAAIVVVDMTNEVTIGMANVWKQTVMNKLTKLAPGDNDNNNNNNNNNGPPGGTGDGGKVEVPVDPVGFPVLLLGNKFDIIEEEIYNELASRKVSASMDVPMDMNFEHPSVTSLNEVAERHGFMGSVQVSARQNDDSVSTAIQSMVRAVLEKQELPRKWRPADEKPRPSKEQPFMYEMLERTAVEKMLNKYHYDKLELVGTQQIDAIVEKADLVVKETSLLQHYYAVALARLKTVCVRGKIVDSEDASFEDCITGLKTGVRHGTSLKICGDEGFYKLEVELLEGMEEVTQTKPWKQAFKCFHNEYAAVCKTILDKGPTLNKALEKYDAAMDQFAEDNADAPTPVNPPSKKKKSEEDAKIELNNKLVRNRAKMQHARNQIKDAIKTVETAGRKISNVDHW